ncbi:MAG: hypothetical protein WBK67_04200 [Minisyncoccales bacterium]|jgi:hypothetical protein
MNYETERIGELQNIENVLDYGRKLERPEPLDFTDTYPEKEILKDLKHLQLAEKRIEDKKGKMSPFEREVADLNEKRGQAFEVLLVDQVYNGEWFGPEAMPVQTSRYDDVLRGVDMIIEFDREDEIERVALAVDASTTSEIDHMERKIKRNIRRVTEDFWPLEVKYFESQINDSNGNYFKGELKGLIPIVIGADRQNADRVFDIFSELISLEKRNNKELRDERRWLREKLSRHPIQKVFFEQAEVQLQMYKSILSEKGKDTSEVEDLLSIVSEVSRMKEDDGFSSGEEILGDKTLDNIKIISRKYLP